MALLTASPDLSGVGPFEEELVSINGLVIEVATALENLSHVAGLVGIAVTHSSEDLDLIIESLNGGRGEA